MSKRGLWDFYTSFIGNWISGGQLIHRGNLSSLGIKPLFDRIVTKTHIKKVICITKFPIHYEYCLLEVLNDIVKTAVPEAMCYTNAYSVPTKSDFKSRNFKTQMARCETVLNQYRQAYESLNGTDKTLGKKVFGPGGFTFSINKKQLDKHQADYDSYKYIADTIRNGGQITDTFFFVEIIAPNNKLVNSARNAVVDYLYNNEFEFNELSANSSAYMSNFTPASYMPQFTTKEFQPMTMSNENMTFTLPINCHGFIGNGKGVCFGMDMKSKTPFILNLTGSGKAQVILLIAASGYGKTMAALFAALNLLGNDIHVSALDIKGDEWIKLAKYTKYTLVDISENSDRYVNTMRVDDLHIDSVEDARKYLNMAKTATTELCLIISSPSEDNRSMYESLLRVAINKVYNMHEVDPDVPESLKRTSSLQYTQILVALNDIAHSETYKDKQLLINDIIITLSNKFRESNIFKGSEITMSEILESPLVIYSLNKNSDLSFTTDEAIRTMMISYLDQKKIAHRKKLRKFTACVYEEMQRAQSEFASLLSFIGSMVTGARSSNAIILLLGNSIHSFEDERMRSITSNITTYIIGPTSVKRDIESLESLGCDELTIKYITSIAEEPMKYPNYFVCKYNTGLDAGVTNIKIVSPDNLIEGFKTRDVQ